MTATAAGRRRLASADATAEGRTRMHFKDELRRNSEKRREEQMKLAIVNLTRDHSLREGGGEPGNSARRRIFPNRRSTKRLARI